MDRRDAFEETRARSATASSAATRRAPAGRIEKTTHDWIEEVDRVGKAKELEIMEV